MILRSITYKYNFNYFTNLENWLNNASVSLELSLLINPVSVFLNKALKIINFSSLSTSFPS